MSNETQQVINFLLQSCEQKDDALRQSQEHVRSLEARLAAHQSPDGQTDVQAATVKKVKNASLQPVQN